MKRGCAWLICLLVLCGCSAKGVYGMNSADINAKQGDTFTVELKENQSKGSRWLCYIDDTSILTIDSDRYVESMSDKPGEADGRRVLVFRTKKKGDTSIMLVCQLAHQGGASDERIYFWVHVF